MKATYILVLLIVFSACKVNHLTGKKTFNAFSNKQLFPMALQQYNSFLKENEPVVGTIEQRQIVDIGKNIANAAQKYFAFKGQPNFLKDYNWEYNLVKNAQRNAWCMPGGKIVFYSGILPIAKNIDGIAAIMGHEVAHALANHGQQRMSAGMLQQFGAVAGNIAIKDEKSRNAFNQYYGVGSQVGVMLPFSRGHETESDQIGIYLMAIAGYNPEEASKLWKRMKANSGGQAPPEFLSTHPSNDTRIANLKAWAPKAKVEAKKFGVTTFRQK